MLTLAHAAAANSLCYLAPRKSPAIASSPWGIQPGTLKTNILDHAAELGAKWTRLDVFWPTVEKEKGRYDFTAIEEAFGEVLSRGITPFVTLSGGNPLYSEPVPNPDPKWQLLYGIKPGPPILKPEATAAWLAFIDTTVRRYHDRIKYWEIWNEPNHYGFWGAPPNASDYGRLMRLTAERIRAIDPSAIIIGGAVAGLMTPEFVEGFLKEDTAHLVNVVSYHHYSNMPEDRMYFADETWKILRAHNPALSLWQTECGYPSASSTKDFRGVSPWGPTIQAKWLLRQAFVDTYFLRAKVSDYYLLFDDGNRQDKQVRPALRPVDELLGFPAHPEGRRVRGVGVNEKCLLANPDLTPKQAYYAYQNLCTLLDGRYHPMDLDRQQRIFVRDSGMFSGAGEHDDAFPSVPLLAAYQTTKGHTLLAYWLPWQPQEYTPRPARIELRIEDVAFSEPVLINLLSGEVRSLSKPKHNGAVTIFSGLPMLDFPIVIAERSEVPLTNHHTTLKNDAVPLF